MAQESERPFSFDFGSRPVLIPGPGESPDFTYGYYLLEKAERAAMREALPLFAQPVSLWYAFLTSIFRTLEGERERFPERADNTRRELMTLGLSSSKVALDALLAGYYHVSYASIRHVTECWFLSRYLVCHPEKYEAFYTAKPGRKKPKLPDTDGIIKDVAKCNHPLAPTEIVKNVKQVWVNMHVGAHATDQGLVQAMANEKGFYHIGATFVPGLALNALQNGLYATHFLMHDCLHLMRGDDEALNVFVNLSRAMDDVLIDIAKQLSELERK